MIRALHKNEDVSLNLNIDTDFTGILIGSANDVSEGCVLKGELVMEVSRKTKIKELTTSFTGICRINFKTTSGMGVPTSDGIDTVGLYRKVVKHFDELSVNRVHEHRVTANVFQPGTYKYPFSINIPASIPQSFKGKNGAIDYELTSVASRGPFASKVQTTRPIMLRRCLMNELDPMGSNTQTVNGARFEDIVSYSATAPTMVYCEGGLLTLDLHVQLKNPEQYSVRMVTCALQEKVFYRTTGKNSLTNQAMEYTDIGYPLGCSSFFPSQHPNYNPSELHNYNAVFRLYPRVHTDNKSKLITVQHALMIRMIVDDNDAISKLKRKKSTDTVKSAANPRSFLSHLALTPNSPELSLTKSAPPSHHHMELSRSPSISEQSESSSSLSSDIQANSDETTLVRVSSGTSSSINPDNLLRRESSVRHDPLEDVNVEDSDRSHRIGHSLPMYHHFNPYKYNRVIEEGSYECRLLVPVIVTSREEYREGSVPALPDYETAVDEPPSYLASLQALPPVPIYVEDETTANENQVATTAS